MTESLWVQHTGDDLWDWIKVTPIEILEDTILRHVRIVRDVEGKRNAKNRKEFWCVTDIAETELVRIPIQGDTRAHEMGPLIARALVAACTCECGNRLLVGEYGQCSLCESSQTMELLRMQGDLVSELEKTPDNMGS